MVDAGTQHRECPGFSIGSTDLCYLGCELANDGWLLVDIGYILKAERQQGGNDAFQVYLDAVRLIGCVSMLDDGCSCVGILQHEGYLVVG